MTMFKKLISIFLTAQIIACCSLAGNCETLELATPETVAAKEVSPINIAMATDNNYAYPTIVSMTSILENKKHNTKIDFYIMLSGDFNEDIKTKIMSLQDKYSNCRITLVDMKDKFKGLHTSAHITTAAYYRLSLASLFPNLDKILYLDTDILVIKDLSELYNYNLDNYYLAGVLATQSNIAEGNIKRRIARPKRDYYLKKFGIENYKTHYINDGIALFNLAKIRKDSLEPKLVECATKYKHKNHDQDVLNIVCYDSILNIPNLYNKLPHLCKLNEQVIIHFFGKTKPWNDDKVALADLWWQYAEKSGYRKEIKSKFSKAHKKLEIQKPTKKRKAPQKQVKTHRKIRRSKVLIKK